MPSSNYELLPQEGTSSWHNHHDDRASTHSGPVRPPTYYGEGPFDPPSSEDEDESLLQKENAPSLGRIERAGFSEPDVEVRPILHTFLRAGLLIYHSLGRAQRRTSSLRYLLVSLGALVAISVVIGIVSAFTYSGTATFHGKLKATLDHISNGTFRPEIQSLLWVPEGAWFVFPGIRAGYK